MSLKQNNNRKLNCKLPPKEYFFFFLFDFFSILFSFACLSFTIVFHLNNWTKVFLTAVYFTTWWALQIPICQRNEKVTQWENGKSENRHEHFFYRFGCISLKFQSDTSKTLHREEGKKKFMFIGARSLIVILLNALHFCQWIIKR